MGIGAPDPTQMAMAAPQGGAGGGQGVQILQQIQNLLAQLAQVETDPGVQRAVNSMQQLIDPLMQAVGTSDAQDMTSGLANPGGGPSAADLLGPGSSESSEGGSGGRESSKSPKSFEGAKKAAMANFSEKGHFSKSGSKGEQLQTEKAKNRQKK